MINSIQLREVIQKYGSPFYLFDANELRTRVQEIKKRLGKNIELCYAMKANPFLISYLDADIDRFEVCSPGEYEICKKEKIISEKIVFSGVYKRREDFKISEQDGFNGVYTIESKRQFIDLYGLAKETSKKFKIILRLTNGSQFGMDEMDLIGIISDTEKMSHFELDGIHYFSGTQKKNREIIKSELNELDRFCQIAHRQTGILIEKIEYGPGLFIDYFGSQNLDYSEVEYLNELLQEKRQYRYVIELGRYIAATCGMYLTSVVDVKYNRGKKYCIVDGGIHHITYYGQMLGLKVPPVEFISQGAIKDEMKEKWTVCGALCTIHDVLLRDYMMNCPNIGDLLVFKNAGAYSVTETGCLFLSRELPLILLLDENQTIEVLRNKISSALINSRSGRR